MTATDFKARKTRKTRKAEKLPWKKRKIAKSQNRKIAKSQKRKNAKTQKYISAAPRHFFSTTFVLSNVFLLCSFQSLSDDTGNTKGGSITIPLTS
jgi:hypothetical protein